MAMTSDTAGPYEPLRAGKVIQYIEQRIFSDKIDSLDAHIDRKKALADPFRYSILYVLYEYGEISRKRLTAHTGKDSNDLQHHLRDLLDANLIEQIPAPEGADGRQTYYQITTLGKQEIAADLRNIVNDSVSSDRFELLGDPELVDSLQNEDDEVYERPVVINSDQTPTELNQHRKNIRGRSQLMRVTLDADRD